MEAGPSLEPITSFRTNILISGAGQKTSLSRSSQSAGSGGEKQTNGRVEINLKVVDSFQQSQDRWNTNEDLASILISAQNHPEWISEGTLTRPASGTQIMYRRKDGASHFKQDGYIWKTRKDGKMPREDHMKLKVKGMEFISANYVHSALVPTFHRRAYSLLSNPEIVFVHYLNVPPPQNAIDIVSETPLEDRISTSLRTFAHLPKQELLEQLMPMLHSSVINPSSQVPVTKGWVESLIDKVKVKHSIYQQKLRQGTGSEQSKIPIPPCNKEPFCSSTDLKSQHPANHNSSVVLVLPASGCLDQSVIYNPNPVDPEIAKFIAVSSAGFLKTSDPVAHPSANRRVAKPSEDGVMTSKTTSTFIHLCTQPSESTTETNDPAPSSPQQDLKNAEVQLRKELENQQTVFAKPVPLTISLHPQHSPVARSSSCSSTSKSVLSSIRIRREPSTISEPNADEVFQGADSLYAGREGLLGAQGAVGSDSQLESLGSDSRPDDSAYNSFADPNDNCAGVDRMDALGPPANSTANTETSAGVAHGNMIPPFPDRFPSTDPCLPTSDLHFIDSNSNSPISNLWDSFLNSVARESGTANSESQDPHFVQYSQHSAISSSLQSYDNTLIPQGDPCPLPHIASNSGELIRNFEQQISPPAPQQCFNSSAMARSCEDPNVNRSQGPSSHDQRNAYIKPTGIPNDHEKGATHQIPSVGTSLHFPMENDSSAVAQISDYSPDWSFPEGNVKILVSGPWYLSGHSYACSFGRLLVPAFLVQNGVLRCYCPQHPPGQVPMRVHCDGNIISNQVSFEYRNREDARNEGVHLNNMAVGRESHHNIQNQSSAANHSETKRFVLGLLDRLEHLEGFLNRKGRSYSSLNVLSQKNPRGIPETAEDLEDRFVSVCVRMSQFDWIEFPVSSDSFLPGDMRLLHFAAALGFNKLIATLLRWRAERPSPHLMNEVSPLMRDEQGRTPLFWACIRGNLHAARLLLQYNRAAISIPDNFGNKPIAAASERGLQVLVNQLKALCDQQSDGSHANFTADGNAIYQDGTAEALSVDATTCWVLTDGESISSREVMRRGNLTESQSRSGSFRKNKKSTTNNPDTSELAFLRTGRRSSFSVARERAKRTSVEGVDSLLEEAGADEELQSWAFGGGTEAKVTKQMHEEGEYETSSSVEGPLSVEIPMDIELPDSPRMEQMFEQATSPHMMMDDGARAQIFTLAQQIIEALPARIKQEDFPEDAPVENRQKEYEARNKSPDRWSSATVGSTQRDMSPVPSAPSADFLTYRFIDPATPRSSNVASPVSSVGILHSPMARSTPVVSSTPGSEGSSAQKDNGNSATTAELGAFFNANRLRKSPLERHFQELTLSDREQRELYSAARIIQNAFRQYKSRTSQRQLDVERRAAVVIQSYYRRYKQFCYFKKLHRAAVLIQKHFRLYKMGKQNGKEMKRCGGVLRRGSRSLKSHRSSKTPLSEFDATTSAEEEQFWEDMIDAHSVSSEELSAWKRHLAAIRIQHAYRGHYMRKRQAAAIKIQKFMRESRQKLQKERASDGPRIAEAETSGIDRLQ